MLSEAVAVVQKAEEVPTTAMPALQRVLFKKLPLLTLPFSSEDFR